MQTASQAGLPNRTLRFQDKNNWAPRFGLAYRPEFLKNTVVRLGYGVFFEGLQNGNNYSNITATSIDRRARRSLRHPRHSPRGRRIRLHSLHRLDDEQSVERVVHASAGRTR